MAVEARQLIKQERMPTLWCPGCGIGIVFHQTAAALAATGHTYKNTAVVSGIGCSGRMAGYFNLDSVHTTHGRALPVAEGIARYRPDLKVVVASGDGDLTSIGGNHLLHTSRRDTNLTVLVVNNEIYGMTGGQSAPTTKPGRITQTAPTGSVVNPINIQGLITSNAKYFYARTTVFHVPHLKKCLAEALAWPGFSLIEIHSNCPERLGRMNKMKSPGDMILAYKELFHINPRPAGILAADELGIVTKK